MLVSQALRNRARDLRDRAFTFEWLSVATTVLAMTLAYRVILSLLLVDQAPLGLSLMAAMATIIAYPLVVLVSQTVFGVRKLAPGDLDAMGSRA